MNFLRDNTMFGAVSSGFYERRIAFGTIRGKRDLGSPDSGQYVNVILPPDAGGCKNVCWMYSVLIEHDFGMSGDGLMEHSNDKGIDTCPSLYLRYQLPMYRISESFPAAEERSRKGINLSSSTRLSDGHIKNSL